ncbi:MAG: ABC transporter substrate-binding protein [Bryobacterales bacterium]|nr:ABC transporter substrate-binding protein [Bryobacterales bacterium]
MRLRTGLALLAGALLLQAACSGNRRPSGKLVIGVNGSLNLGSNNPVLIQRNANVWEALTELDDSLTAQPQLAESWQATSDGRQWRLRLKRGVRFHDGAALSAPLVAANVLRLKDHPELDYYSTFVNLASAAIDDEFTVRLVFSRPMVDLPNKVGHYFAGIFSPAAFGPDGKLGKPIGSGPYVFAESRIGQYDRVTAFDQYHGGRPYFREIEFRIIPDPVVRLMSLIRGDIDMIAHHGGVPAPYLDLLRNKPGIVVASQDVAITHYLLFNCSRRPFLKMECRDAFSRSLDRAGLVERILQGAGSPARDFLVDRASRWNRGRFSVQPDASGQVKQELKACAGSSAVVLLLSQSDLSAWGYRHVADYLADYFSRLGVPVRVEALEGGAWQKATQDGRYDITLYPLSTPTGTPELLIRRLAFSAGMRIRSIGNTTHFLSGQIDSLFTEALEAPDAATQERGFNHVLDLLAKEQPFVPLYHERYYYAYRRGLAGVHVDPFLKLDLGRLHWEEPHR